MTFDLPVLEKDLKEEFQHYHVRAQIIRFTQAYVGVFVTALASGGFHTAGWAALGALAVGCLWTALRQFFPTIPWGTVQNVINNYRTVISPLAPAPELSTPPSPTPPVT